MKKIPNAVASLALLLVCAIGRAATEAPAVKLNIDAPTMAKALIQFTEQSGLHLIFPTDGGVAQLPAPRVVGAYTPEAALRKLLGNTGLEYEYLDAHTIAVRPKSKEEDAAKSATNATGGLDAERLRMAQGEEAQSGKAGIGEKEGSQGAKLEEVVVTAQRRKERLQDVPISITALSEEALKRSGADRFQDYISQIPGAFYSDQGPGRSRINFRGLQTHGDLGFEQNQSATAIYIDDLPALNMATPWVGTDLRIFDVERIEVLRGPQGTLFGSGSLGGAVRIITNKPNTKAFAASAEGVLETTHGGDPSERISSMVNVPLVEDKLAVRMVGYYRHDGGYVDNTFRGQKNVNDGDSTGGRFMLGYTPTENLSLRFTLTHQEDDFADPPTVLADHQPPYEYNSWTPAFTKVNLTSYNLSLDYNFGPTVLTSSTTYGDSHANMGQGLGELLDLIFQWRTSPSATLTEDNRFVTQTTAQELRLASSGTSTLQWVVGGLYLKQKATQADYWAASTVGEMFSFTTPSTIEEKAIFGNVDWRVTNVLTLTAGARVFRYDVDNAITQSNGGFGITTHPVQKVDASSVSPRYAIQFKPSNDFMAYVQAARGFRVGQPNQLGGAVGQLTGAVVPLGYDSDKLWNYEIGEKTELLDKRLKINTALFYVDWKDIPLIAGLPGEQVGYTFTTNAGNAISKGAELELAASPTSKIEFGVALSYTDAKLTFIKPGTFGGYQRGDRLPGTPKFYASDYVQFSTPKFINAGNAYLRLAHRYAGKQIGDLNNRTPADAWSDNYNAFDMRAGLKLKQYELVFNVDNIANSDAITIKSVFPPNSFAFGGNTAYRLRPRTIGLTVRADF